MNWFRNLNVVGEHELAAMRRERDRLAESSKAGELYRGEARRLDELEREIARVELSRRIGAP
jgi:hypothetical protein